MTLHKNAFDKGLSTKIIKKFYLRKIVIRKANKKIKKKLLNITWNLIAENTKDTYDWRTDVSNIFIKFRKISSLAKKIPVIYLTFHFIYCSFFRPRTF
jgi:hypothetical protein